MIDLNSIIKLLKSYNINSHKYGPTIYQKDNDLGICLELKDSLFGFLTRIFTFDTIDDFDNFLKKYFWVKNNQNYHIELTLDDYETKNPHLKYIYHDKELNYQDMLNIKTIDEPIEVLDIDNTKDIYLENIKELTNYLINLKEAKNENINIKNNLKNEENDLKHTLLENLALYYGKNKQFEKKTISFDLLPNKNDIDLLKTNLQNIQDKNTEDIKTYLESLINLIKEEELDEKNLINIYSTSVYKYNIEILKKQIAFVKNKIETEKNFNIKGSVVHNIDAELKSFLKTNTVPKKIEVFIEENKEEIEKKFQKITNIADATLILTGKTINLKKETPISPETINNREEIINNLNKEFDNLDSNTKAKLIIYNSFYKDICNYLINNNYDQTKLKETFNFDYYYEELTNIIYNENNNHYLVNYFNVLNLKNIDTFINSLIDICKTIENTKFKINDKLKIFSLEDYNIYKAYTINPIYNAKTKVYLSELNNNHEFIYIPNKIEIDEETKEFFTIATKNIYLKGNIEETIDTIKVINYQKTTHKDKKHDIIITTDIVKQKENIFNISNIKGEE